MTIAKLVLPKEKLFYVAFNVAGKPLFVHTVDPIQQGTRDKWISSVETSFLREDVATIEVWEVRGPGEIGLYEQFTPDHADLHFATCQCGCDKRVFTKSRYARCTRCQRLKCSDHGAFLRKTDEPLCLECYEVAKAQEG